MATRNTPARLIPGNPLGSVLRDLTRQTRRTSRRTGATGATGPAGADGRTVTVVAEPATFAEPVLATTAMSTDDTGVAMWSYPVESEEMPTLSATAVGEQPATVSVQSVSCTEAVLQAWHFDGTPAAGVALHLVAFGKPLLTTPDPEPEPVSDPAPEPQPDPAPEQPTDPPVESP